jgi:hypothetical protein
MEDLAVRHHPRNKALIQCSPRIYRYEMCNQLWSEFGKVQPGIADKIHNTISPNECPTMIRMYAPWEMVKGTDSLCLCINCKGMNSCWRGCMGAIKVIDQLIMQYNVSSDEHFTVNNNNDDVPLHMNIEGTQEHFTLNNINDVANDSELVDDSSVGSESVFDDKLDEEVTEANAIPSCTVPIEDERTATKMKQILDILKMKTKYDSCKACLPCLPEMGNLEDAKLSCVNGECYCCGFDKLWSKGVRRVIILKGFDNQQKE